MKTAQLTPAHSEARWGPSRVMRFLRTAGLWFLTVLGVFGLVVVVTTLLDYRWPNNIASIVFTISFLALLTVAFLALIGVGVYFLFWQRRRGFRWRVIFWIAVGAVVIPVAIIILEGWRPEALMGIPIGMLAGFASHRWSERFDRHLEINGYLRDVDDTLYKMLEDTDTCRADRDQRCLTTAVERAWNGVGDGIPIEASWMSGAHDRLRNSLYALWQVNLRSGSEPITEELIAESEAAAEEMDAALEEWYREADKGEQSRNP